MSDALDIFLRGQGLASNDATYKATPLSGGVSSEIWRVDFSDRSICVKRALPQLKVKVDWQVPTIRSSYEWEWLCFAAKCCSGAAPTPIAYASEQHMLAMEYLDPVGHPLWKDQLLEGQVTRTAAASVGRLLAKLHTAGAHNVELARRFASDDIFFALRLDPYMLETARQHPDLASVIGALVERTASTRVTVVHGDVSPKNILISRDGPILLDAEAAWYGDPAFDLAFCLNHLLLKCLVRPTSIGNFLAAFAALKDAYIQGVTWEDPGRLEVRASSLLPVLFLARVDGKSPVEYITTEAQQNIVREAARPLIARPPSKLVEVSGRWRDVLTRARDICLMVTQ
jgi:aminoglycoside phosphotransferase (APT) family kinase protein